MPCCGPGCALHWSSAMPSAHALLQAGINTLLAVRPSGPVIASPRTLAAGNAGAARLEIPGRTAAQRCSSRPASSAARAGCCSSRTARPAWRRAQAQVQTFLDFLDQQGAFAGATPEESYFAICDERVNEPHAVAAGKVKVLFGFAITKPCDFHAFLVTHHAGASRCRPVSPSRFATAPDRLQWEIETAVLRGTSIEV